MYKLQADSDKADLMRLENIVRRCKAIGTPALSRESGISAERIYDLATNHFCSLSWKPDPVGSSFGELWTYTPTMADKGAEYESKVQESQMERQRQKIRVQPF
jgi:hypothetical protein